jgi:prepilin-type N-terminal cleavage/methylation domain-containing protein
MKSAPPASPGRPRGFTVIELLVAVGVTAILVALMVSISLNVLGAWNRSSGLLTTNGTARTVLDQLSQDLSSAVLRRDGNVWLAATIQRDPPGDGDADTDLADWGNSDKPSGTTALGSLALGTTTVAPPINELRFGKAGVWLRFFTTPPAANGGPLEQVSAPRAVAYQIIRRDLGTAANPQFAYQLFRSEVRPYSDVAAEQPRSTFGFGYNLYSTAPQSYNATNNPGADQRAATIRNPRPEQLIGNDVIDFGLRLFERNAAGALVEVFPVNRRASPVGVVASVATAPLAYAATTGGGELTDFGNPSATTRGFPVAAEILVRVLTPEGVRLIQAFEEGLTTRPPGFANDGEYWWDIADKHSQVFTRYVEIKSRPL